MSRSFAALKPFSNRKKSTKLYIEGMRNSNKMLGITASKKKPGKVPRLLF